jgi:lipopolysaccharide transport system ATP-binding protein
MKSVLTVQNVTKTFRTYNRYHAGLKTLLLNPRLMATRREMDQFLAVDAVSFQVKRSETFGLVGPNGAGKSTLLALIAGILRPTSGAVTVHGRISPLLELGVGFTLELTAAENIVINGVLLGLRRKEVEARMKDIVEFSDLGAFIDQPLKTYSSGMLVRLAFSVAIHVQPDILLVDEVLAVGDEEFQKKCLDRIALLRRNGVTIVFVSHNLQIVAAMCDRAAYMSNGRLLGIGTPAEMIALYKADMARRDTHLCRVSEPVRNDRLGA